MDLWNIRNQALAAISSELKQENELVEYTFSLIDRLIERFHALDENDPFAAICCVTLIKARRQAAAIYSLCLDGLGLEAGPIFRLMIETLEVLTYFYQDPTRVEKAMANKLPKAGEIAGIVHGSSEGLKPLRDYFNEVASHLSYSLDAIPPIKATFDKRILIDNLGRLYAMIWMIVRDGVVCLSLIEEPNQTFIDEIDMCQEKGVRIFEIEKRLVAQL